MERALRLGALTACLVLVATVAALGPRGDESDAWLLVGVALGLAAIITNAGLAIARQAENPVDAVRALPRDERRALRRAWRRPSSVPPGRRDLARAYAGYRARVDGLAGWSMAGVVVFGVSSPATPAVWSLGYAAPVLAGFFQEYGASRWRRAQAVLTDPPVAVGPG